MLNPTNTEFSCSQKWMVGLALVLYVFTSFLCLWELRIDAQRNFVVARELEKPRAQQDWDRNIDLSAARSVLMVLSYIAVSLATLISVFFLVTHLA